jgi:hypothetical protein
MDAAQTPEHLKQEETADWLRAHAQDMSFAGLCDDLKLGQAILPYQREKDGVHSAFPSRIRPKSATTPSDTTGAINP